ncbi:response regulator transcription factor [Zoogloea sp.]|uniref:response regulator n=1 Tax=Zoogloea sp. TaxID=49181 RepID=UPI0025EA08BA|nr:response regulator transcription factor [Zoogloea sp.]MCK6393653.1 response regulator transcription factor [Zoogloea sp.]
MADDHFVVRQGMRQIIGLFPDMDVVGEAADGTELLNALVDREVDLILLDMTMPGLSGVDLIERIGVHHPGLPILVLSMHKEAQIAIGALRAGANGYVTKDSEPSTLAEAIRRVASGKRYVMPELAEEMVFTSLNEQATRLSILSPREREVLEMIVSGDSMVQIADKLHLSAKTVSTHKTRLMQKLNIQNNAELILVATSEGIRPRAPVPD